MSLTVKPTGKVDWANNTVLNSPTGTANKTEYDAGSNSRELFGWQYAEFPPYHVLNEWQYRVSQWHKWSEANLDDLDTRLAVIELEPVDPVDPVDPVVGLTPGDVIISFDDVLPTGFIWFDNGAALDRTTYADIFTRYGIRFGLGDGVTTFNVPDSAGYFMRIMGTDVADDPDIGTRTDRGDGSTGGVVGTKQNFAVEQHGHFFGSVATTADGGGSLRSNYSPSSNNTDQVKDVYNANVADETRPKNINIRLICKI